jgi:hypothetical protein
MFDFISMYGIGDKVCLTNICELGMFHHHLLRSKTGMRTFDLLFSLAWTKHTSKQNKNSAPNR